MSLEMVFLCGVITGLVVFSYMYCRRISGRQKHACVVVLGDIGRSPRIQNHCISLTKLGFTVDFVGYSGSIPHRDVTTNDKIKLVYLNDPPALIQNFPRLIIYGLKVVWQSIDMLIMLVTRSPPSHILLQNPPAIPTLAICWLASKLHGSVFVVDWHNYGYTILELALGERHPLVRFGKWYEHLFGRLSSYNICVTQAIKEDLAINWNIKARTMYDRAPTLFKQTDLQTQHSLFKKLAKDYPQFKSRNGDDAIEDTTAFTELGHDGQVIQLPQRPALLISSTSWTEDEDFSVLLSALEEYEKRKIEGTAIPDLICIITGKGPQKEYYKQQIELKTWEHVSVCTPWLEAEDYPKLLGSADVGVCLHTSSSGFDLPMKVVDMFGCGLPVCAIHFKCLHELVEHNKNGMVFKSDNELANQLQELLCGFPDSCDKLRELRHNLEEFQKVRWDEAWNKDVKPIFIQ